MWYPSSHISHTPPTRAKGSDSITIALSATLPNWKKRSRKMIARVMGTTTISLRLARSMASNCPDHSSRYPGGSSSRSSSSAFASAT